MWSTWLIAGGRRDRHFYAIPEPVPEGIPRLQISANRGSQIVAALKEKAQGALEAAKIDFFKSSTSSRTAC
jgi:hypothetical protein